MTTALVGACGQPHVRGQRCRECDTKAARERVQRRRARLAQGQVTIPMRHGRPLVSARIAALIEECRPAYLLAISPRRTA